VCQAGLPVSASQPPLDSAFSSRFLTHVGPRNRCFAAGALRVLGKHQPLSIRLWIVPPDLHLRSGSYASFPGVLLVSSLLPKLPTFPEPGFAPRGTWLGVSLPRDDALVARGELWAARTPVRVASDSAPGSHPPIRAIDYFRQRCSRFSLASPSGDSHLAVSDFPSTLSAALRGYGFAARLVVVQPCPWVWGSTP
jgi:hypothetical protein